MKIIITGGHHNSALAVVRELKKRGTVDFLWLGHKYTMWGDREPGAEYKEVTAAGIPFYELKAGKVYKTLNLLMWLRVPWGFFQAFYRVWRFRPNLILSFGGYLAVPVALAGWILRIPVVTHEQTSVVSWSNRVITKLAQKIFISWPQSQKYLPAEKTILTGLPLREEIFQDRKKVDFQNSLPTLYITGGKQGSHIINEVISKILSKLLENYNAIHQVGSTTVTRDYQKLREQAKGLPEDLAARYILKDYFFEQEIGSVFAAADFVISRAGAHTIYELAALGKPCILVPIPWVSHNEQYKNARILVNEGLAKLIPENELTTGRFLREIDEMQENLASYQEHAQAVRELIRFDAAQKIADEIFETARQENPTPTQGA